ncbi:SH3 domain-containing protein [Gallaecimonas xiamenensis]|nr:SH3 domain-containing protein [Gallaecimonas xiamenensis]
MAKPWMAGILALVLLGQAQAEPVWQSDVVAVQPQQLEAAHWLAKLKDPDALVMDAGAIARFNQGLFDKLPEMVALDQYPRHLEGTSVRAKIEALGLEAERYRRDGSALDQAAWDNYRRNLNLDALQGPQQVRFALAVRRSLMRTFPTHDRVFKADLDTDLDRFQETGVFPGQALAVLADSADGNWVFAQSYQYAAWLPKADIAFGSREQVLAYGRSPSFLVTTGAKVRTVFNPEEPRVSELQLDMGLRLPLLPAARVGNNLYGQNPYTGYVVRLPVRNDDGSLAFRPALIPRSQDVHLGYLPFTRANLIRQAFKFLGERYGWGHDYNGRDCTGFVGEVYRSFGILMPRNSGQQGKGDYGVNHPFSKATPSADKEQVLAKGQPGDLIYLPGHVMMLLGFEGKEPYVIHDVTGLRYRRGGQLYQGVLNGVSITPLKPLMLGAERSYLDGVYNIKAIN